MSKAVIALGTNIGDRIGNINLAVRAVSRLPGVKIIDGSSVYETEPVGVTDQPKFYNAAILVEASVSPAMLLGGCLGIEAAMGRVRGEKNGPRIVDLDLLLYENYKSESFELTLPHPEILNRAFVMKPLSDLFPSGRALGLFFAQALRETGEEGITDTGYKLVIPEDNDDDM
ncbi:MAG: 2-amino-4-hydroxy-6-hydroxymethyldihydropteridine diphosphokinase [Clostridia bacterium]|nr:2-amino-4-hydroxy-6-hydroxymethyldihydropteridine diphosphokinase [Clostridia bacterium]MBQ6467167.1 2-amino-4-hydroxy-6-hydroxymethyldihydropteridine diphosphokinase [Clostridia bacterium]MBR5772222.1 2-amino-4-hydroxy-6-hydroxymethyldihydropteridine diphosphokinase [Clostridia bacterium]MBR6335980.1 2-amino-4-hydroxy-6-hydroxymethyldihydropteridine diphosphokinase [Clostridia bacterium]